MRVLKIASTGMMAQQLNVEVISNNIANINTSAYKRSRAEFSDLMYQSQRREGSFSSDSGTIVPVGVQVGLGVKPAAVARMTAQGNLQNTSNKLDLAIEGRGYFSVTLPDGETAYTRAGSFQLSPEGLIVTKDGYEVQPSIAIPEGAGDVEINRNGEVFVRIDGQNEPQLAGRFTIAAFINEAGLEALGDNLFKETPASGLEQAGLPGEDGFGSLRQGYIETSNVNAVEEITDLISAQRAYEMNAKVIETGDQMSSTITNMR